MAAKTKPQAGRKAKILERFQRKLRPGSGNLSPYVYYRGSRSRQKVWDFG